MAQLEIVSIIAFIAAALGLNVFMIAFAVERPWREPGVSRQFFHFMLVVTIIMNLASLFTFYHGPYWLEHWLSAILYCVLATVIWWFTVGLLSNRIKTKIKK